MSNKNKNGYCSSCKLFIETVEKSLEERKPYQLGIREPYLPEIKDKRGNMIKTRMHATNPALVWPYCQRAGGYVNSFSQRPCGNGSKLK